MASKILRFQVDAAHDGVRLDRLVMQAAGASRRVARLWIAAGHVRVNGKPVRILTRPIKQGACLEVAAEREQTVAVAVPEPGAQAHPTVEILYLDKYVVAVNKPARLLSERDRFGSPSLESVLPKLLAARGERNTKLWLVHRLDAGTSGVMVLARTPTAVKELSETFRRANARKTYLALCVGVLARAQLIDAPLGRAQGTRHQVTASGKPAQTHVELAAAAPDGSACVVRARPRTGRTHQIRVHLSHLGHPLWGDRLYGGPGLSREQPPRSIGRAMLHARALVLPHPLLERPLELQAPPPEDFCALAAAFGIEPGWQEG